MRREWRRLAAWALYDWANAGYATVIQTFVFAAYFTSRVAEDPETGTVLWGRAIAAAGLIVSIAAPVLGAVADRGARRRPWLVGFVTLAVASTAGLAWVAPEPSSTWLALSLVFCAAVGSELANVFYNALLPELARADRIGRWSGIGWGLGYVGGLVCLVLALLAFLGDEPWLALDRTRGEAVRATCLLAAGWYAAFALPLLLLRHAGRQSRSLRRAATTGLRQLAATWRRLSRHTGIVRFLCARMLYVDGLATLFAFGGIYAAGTFGMGEAGVLRFGIGLSLSAGLGAWLFSRVDDRIGGKRTAVVALVGLLATGSAALLARDMAEFWIAALALGLFVGPLQAASRSYLARRAPDTLRHELFGFYALSGKATAFVGPLLVAQITALTGSQRAGMGIVLALLAAGLLLLAGVPSDAPTRPERQRSARDHRSDAR